MATLSLSAVDGLGRKSCVALAADHFLTFVLSGESGKRSLDLEGAHTTTPQPEDEMQSRLLLDVVIGKSPTVLELFACEDQSLLIWRDSLFVLNFGFDIFNCVSRLDIKGDSLTSQRLDENLHYN